MQAGPLHSQKYTTLNIFAPETLPRRRCRRSNSSALPHGESEMLRDDLAPAKLSNYPCDPIGRVPHRLFKTSLWRANQSTMYSAGCAALIGRTHARGYSRANLPHMPQILTVGRSHVFGCSDSGTKLQIDYFKLLLERSYFRIEADFGIFGSRLRSRWRPTRSRPASRHCTQGTATRTRGAL